MKEREGVEEGWKGKFKRRRGEREGEGKENGKGRKGKRMERDGKKREGRAERRGGKRREEKQRETPPKEIQKCHPIHFIPLFFLAKFYDYANM